MIVTMIAGRRVGWKPLVAVGAGSIVLALEPFGPRRQLFAWMANAYANGRGELDEFAASTIGGDPHR